MIVYFENCADYITASNNGEVVVRCNFDMTDCGQTEDLRDFVKRHGGDEKTAEYLQECYANATRL